MADSFYFYDLETSGINPRSARIMQFAGQRTDLDLNPLGEPHNILIALSDDILPEPEAILITGITPQHTQAEGTTEADFLKTFIEEIATPGTIFVGYNTVRFDDEFMRALHYRNFYDPYQWQWKDDRSRWDLLDVVRMTRALRPEGIKWPVDSNGKATNRLELLTAINGLSHENAHDALNDVYATISLAQLIRSKQPKLFDYLLTMRHKDAIKQLVSSGKPFVYSSGKYPGEYEKTAVVAKLTDHPKRGGALVYDLRHDPDQFSNLTVDQIVEAWRWQKPEDRDPAKPRLPIKTLQYNRCPAVAPLAVLDEDSQKRLHVDMEAIKVNLQKLSKAEFWPERVLQALDIMDGEQQQRFELEDKDKTVDSQIYNGFMGEGDNKVMAKVRVAKPEDLSSFIDQCSDQRLKELLPLYKARNFPRKLTTEERQEWEQHRADQLLKGGSSSKIAKYFNRLQQLSERKDLTQNQKYLLEDLRLYGESIMPAELEG